MIKQGHVEVTLESESETGVVYVSKFALNFRSPIQDVLDKWIAKHGGAAVQCACLEYPDQEGTIDTSLTPEQLQWKAEEVCRTLWVVPGEPSCEARPEASKEETKRPLEDAARRFPPEPSPKRRKAGNKHVDKAVSKEKDKDSAVETKDVPSTEKVPSKEKVPSREKTDDKETEKDKDIENAEEKDKDKTPSKDKDKVSGKDQGKDKDKVTSRTPKVKAGSADSTVKIVPPSDPSNVPTGEDLIEFIQPNPKRIGTSSGDRYEKYMTATTVNEARALGAAPGDIVHDFKKGLLKRRAA